MKRRIKKMLILIPITVISVFAGILSVWAIISNGRIKEYRDESGKPIPESISEKTVVEINSVKNGLFINGRDVSNPVLLLISSGPGTDDYFLTERFSDMHIDDMFTVVYWDYRGMGIAYDASVDPKEITTEVLLSDTKAVTDYCKKRFSQDKIYLMGFSGGCEIGIKAAHEYPDDYHAYIGMAQPVTDSTERDRLMYEFMKTEFTSRGDRKNLKKLDKITEMSEDGIRCKDWYSYVMLLHEAGGGTIRNESEFTGIDIPIMLSHCYTIPEKINYIRGMKMYRKTAFADEMKDYDLRKELTEFEIPMFFISGEYDYNCPWPLVEDYDDTLNAPQKNFYKIKDAAHSPLWENEEESYKVLEEIKEKTYER